MSRTAITPSDALAPALPFSVGVRVGHTVQVSGQASIDPATGECLFPGDVKAQTLQVLTNVEAVLAAGGATLDNAVMLRVYLTDRADFAAMNEVYAQFLSERCSSGVLPSRTTVIVGLPHPELLVEIDALAVVE
jgi:reactive intermediate/imine deaminase